MKQLQIRVQGDLDDLEDFADFLQEKIFPCYQMTKCSRVYPNRPNSEGRIYIILAKTP